jgi:hypothetical protein
MRRPSSLPLVALALLGAPPAHAAPAQAPQTGLAAAFGNTVKALYRDGRAQRLWFKADGTWEAIGRRGTWSAGKWRLKDEKVCLKQSRPFPAPFQYCTEFPAQGGLGAVWTSRDMAGEPIRLTVVKGIEKP